MAGFAVIAFREAHALDHSSKILDHLRGEKIHVYKYEPKKNYRQKTGHRQELTLVKVLEVSDGS